MFFINLDCSECDYVECNKKLISKGCKKSVSEELYVEYKHQVCEEWPFYKQCETIEELRHLYSNTIDVLYKVYLCPDAENNRHHT